jgi:hypothetical protein
LADDIFFNWIFWLILFAIIVVVGTALFISFRSIRKIKTETAEQKAKLEDELNLVAAEIEAETINNKERRDKLEIDFLEYITKNNIYPDVEGRYYDPKYRRYITPSILEACKRVIKPEIFFFSGSA